jgi:hypothetical protein
MAMRRSKPLPSVLRFTSSQSCKSARSECSGCTLRTGTNGSLRNSCKIQQGATNYQQHAFKLKNIFIGAKTSPHSFKSNLKRFERWNQEKVASNNIFSRQKGEEIQKNIREKSTCVRTATN